MVDKEYAKRMIPALLRERAGLKQAGKEDRVKMVDEQLKLYGYKSPDADARKVLPEGRSERPRITPIQGPK